jgi:hypothetical protein
MTPRPLLLPLLGLLLACDGGTQGLPAQRVDSGFRMGRDSLSFANFGGLRLDATLTPDGLARMFGPEEVCASVGPDGACKATAVGKAWLKKLNESMAGGRCEGFAVLSGLGYLGVLDVRALGAEGSVSTLQSSTPVRRELAYWFTTQYLPSVREKTLQATGREAVAHLARAYAETGEALDLWRVGMVRLDEDGKQKGGHAILAYAVEPDPSAAGRYLIRVYDNNHPADAERAIVVDARADTWEYRASSNPEEADALYRGTPGNKNRLFLSPLRLREGRHPCKFCSAEDVDASQPLTQVFGSASTDVSVTDAQGRTVGVVGGRAVAELPGATVDPIFTGDGLFGDDAPQLLGVPGGGSMQVRLEGRGGGASAAPGSLLVAGEGWSAGASEVAPGEGEADTLALGAGGSSVSYRPADGSAPTLSFTQSTPGGQELELTVALPPGVESASLDADPATGAVELSARRAGGGEDVPLQVTITQSTGGGEGRTFEGTLTVPSGGGATADMGAWQGDGQPLAVQVDRDGDGAADETRAVVDSGPRGVRPDAPTALTAVQAGEGGAAVAGVVLSWRDAATNEDGFELERAGEDGAFAPVGTVGADVTRFTDARVEHERAYRYRVRAHNASGASAWVEAAVALPAPAPAALRVERSTAHALVLAWEDRALRETAYRVERAPAAEAPRYALLATLPAGASGYTDTGLAPDTAYAYRVSAVGPTGASHAELSARTPALPEAPSALVAQAAGPGAVVLRWSLPAGARTGLELERATDGGAWAPLASLGGDATAHVDVTAQAEREYLYRLRASAAAGASAWSAPAPVTTPPPAPAALVASATSPSSVRLTWQDAAQRETGYRVERVAETGAATVLATRGPDTTSFEESGLTAGTSYRYRVVAVGAGGESAALADVATPAPPPAPSALMAQVAGPTEVRLSWGYTGGPPQSFQLERAQDGGAFQPLDAVDASMRVYTDLLAPPGSTLSYRVRAVSASGTSGWSTVATVQVPASRWLPVDTLSACTYSAFITRAGALLCTTSDGRLLGYVNPEGGPRQLAGDLDRDGTADLTYRSGGATGEVASAGFRAASIAEGPDGALYRAVYDVPKGREVIARVDAGWTVGGANVDGEFVDPGVRHPGLAVAGVADGKVWALEAAALHSWTLADRVHASRPLTGVPGDSVAALAMDATHVYLAADAELGRVPRGGGAYQRLAGSGACGALSPDGAPALGSSVCVAGSLVAPSGGNLFFMDGNASPPRLRYVDAAGLLRTVSASEATGELNLGAAVRGNVALVLAYPPRLYAPLP